MLVIIGMILMAALVPLDWLLFAENWRIYAAFRLGSEVIFLLAIVGIHQAYKRDQNQGALVSSCFMVIIGLSINVMYLFFMHIAAQSQDIIEAQIVFNGTCLVVVFISFSFYRFWIEQYLVHGLSMLAAGCFALYDAIDLAQIKLILVAHICSMVFTFFFRREFASNLSQKFNTLKGFVPPQIARVLVMVGQDDKIHEIFKPQKRFTVCLCCDWRESQQLNEESSPEFVSQLYESFYETVLNELETIIPSGEYFANWTADELFIIFFNGNKDDDPACVAANALQFAGELATGLFERVKKHTDFDFKYDIGMSCGYGLLGLIGPHNNKKTTVVGSVPGVAKRLESQAKVFRQSPESRPTIVLQEGLAQLALEQNLIPAKECFADVANEKNVMGQKIYVWQPSVTLVAAFKSPSSKQDLDLRKSS